MKTQLKNKLKTLSLVAVSLALAGNALAAQELGSKDYLRATIPAASAENARLIYGVDGNKVEANLANGDVIELKSEQDSGDDKKLGNFSFLGYTDDIGNNTMSISGIDPLGYDMVIEFKSTGEIVALDDSIPVVLEADGATVEVVQGGGLDEIQQPAPKVFFGAVAQDFHQNGVLDLRIVIEQPVDDGNNDGQDQGGDNNENQPEAEASGGCSMTANAAGSALNLLGLLPLAGLALARRRK